jgi:hypothetical protein
MSRNIFTQIDVGDIFKTLDYSQPLPFPLTSVDPIYFHVRSFNEKQQLHTPFTDPFREIPGAEAGGFAVVPTDTEPLNEKDLKEVKFLEKLGLAIHRNDKYYISRFAYLLYDDTDGLFREGYYNERDSPDIILRKLTPLFRVFLMYILPGNFWRAYYARLRMPTVLGQVSSLALQMQQAEQWWLSINELVDLPETSPSPPS